MDEVLNQLLPIAEGFWHVVGQMSPYLLFGFLVAGVLSVVISPEWVERHLGGKGIWPVVKASAFGVPLPLCSCGVIPVGASLRRHGASKGATTAFLISTPQTGVDSIFVTFSLLGSVYAVFRVVVALVSGAIGGMLVDAVDGRGERDAPVEPCQEACCNDADTRHWLIRMLHYGFIVLARDIGKALVIGLVVAALITALVPPKFFAQQLGGVMAGGIVAMLIMVAFGIPVYVCATASVPVAAALIAKGVSPGAAMVFLMTGPATNAATIATIWKIMGRRTAAVYLATVAVMAVLAGLLLDALFDMRGVAPQPMEMEMLPPWLTTALAVVLLALVAYATLWPRRHLDRHEHDAAEDDSHSHDHGHHADNDSLVLTISGMTCSHCADSVRGALLAGKGVTKVHVDLDARQATLSGADLDEHAAREAVESLGYTVDSIRGQAVAEETC